MLTLSRLITEIQGFVANHEALNTFVFGDPWEVQSKKAIQYPLLFGMIEPSAIEGTSEGFTMSITVCDLERKDKSNTVKVLSDTKIWAKHFLTYFRQEQFADFFTVEESVNKDPFVESFNDHCAGWTFQVTFKQPYEWDLCGVPYVGQPVNVDAQFVYILDQDNNIIETLTVGQSYTVTQLTNILQNLGAPITTIIQDIT
jgi:hypothetical protein